MRRELRGWEDYCWDHGQAYAIEDGCEDCREDRRQRAAADEARQEAYWEAYEDACRQDADREPDEHQPGVTEMAEAASREVQELTYICGREVTDRGECLAVVHALIQTMSWGAQNGILVFHTTAGRTIVERDPYRNGVWFSHYTPRGMGSIKFCLPEEDVREWLLLGRRDPDLREDLLLLMSIEPW